MTSGETAAVALALALAVDLKSETAPVEDYAHVIALRASFEPPASWIQNP